MTDAEMIERSLADGEAFAFLFDRHFRVIHRFLRARAGVELADELASETFATAFRRRAAFDLSRDDARPWLYGIAVNLLRDHRRSETRRLHAYARTAASTPIDSADAGLGSFLEAALLELGEQDRTLILLHVWADLSYEQLAEALEVPIGTVRSRLSRARGKLRAGLSFDGRTFVTERTIS